MPFPKQQQGAKAKGAGGESTGAACYFCRQQVDREDPQGYIQGTCSKCGTRPFCFQCVADYVEKNVRTLNSNSKAMEKGRNIARNRPQDLFAQNRTVQRKPQNCPDSACSGLMVDAELVKPQKPQQQRAEEGQEENAGAPAPAPAARQPAAKAQPGKAQPAAKAAAAPLIKRLVSAPTATRAVGASSGAEGGDETSRSGSAALSRAASAAAEGASRPASSLSAKPAAAAAAAAARKQLEQQREAAAALRSDLASAGRLSSAAAPASSSSSSSSAAGGWVKVPRIVSAPTIAEKKGPAEEWPALGPVLNLVTLNRFQPQDGTQTAAPQQPVQPQPSAASYASLLDLPRPPPAASRPAAAESAAVEAVAESPAGVAALSPVTPDVPAAALPTLPWIDSEASKAVQDTGSDSDDDGTGADFAGGIAAALRKQQQALLQQLASGQQPWEHAQQAAQQAGAASLPPMQPLVPEQQQQQQPIAAQEPQPAAQAWYEPAPPAAQAGLLPLLPHLSSQPQPWEQQGAVQPAYSWQQQQQQQQQGEASSLWQLPGQSGPAGYDDGYAAGLAAAAAMMQQQQGMGGQGQAFEQAAPPAQAYVPPPQVRPEGDKAEVDALLSLLGIG